MNNGQNLKLGYDLDTPRNIQGVQASKLGDARGTPSSSIKSTRSFSVRYIFIASCDMCYSWSVFIFAVCLFCFVCCSIKLDPSCFVLERDTLLKFYIEHSSFHFHCFLLF